MPRYSFYPSGPQSQALASETAGLPICEEADLPSDTEAMTHARTVLERHGLAVVVDIWDGDRDVGTVSRFAPRGALGLRLTGSR